MAISVNDVNAVLTLSSVLLRMVNDGVMTGRKLREIAASNGATPEELAALDAKLSDAIAAREAERAGS